MKDNIMNKFLISICLFCFCTLLFSEEKALAEDTISLEKVKPVYDKLLAMPVDIVDYWRLCYTDEFLELRKLLRQDPSFLIKNWDALTEGKADFQKRLLLLTFTCSSYSSSSEKYLDRYFQPEIYLKHLPAMLELLKRKKEQVLYFYSIDHYVMVYNFSNPQVASLLNDIIKTSEEWKNDEEVKCYRNILNGEELFTSLHFNAMPPLDGTIKRPYKTYLIGGDYTNELLFNMSAYTYGLESCKKLLRLSEGKKVDWKREAPPIKNAEVIAFYNAIMPRLPDEPKDWPDVKDYTPQKWMPRSYSAELELLKWLKEKKLSLEKRLMIVNVLWRGMYATDQIERFLPMLKADEKEIREMAFNTMPDWLKEGMKYDASKMPTEKEYAAISATVQENIKKNPDKLIVFEQEK